MENRWCAWKPPQQKQKTKQKTNLGGKKQSCVSRRKDQRDNSIKGCQMLITRKKRAAPVSGSLPGLLFARWVMPLLSSVPWKSAFLYSNFSWWDTKENIIKDGKLRMEKGATSFEHAAPIVTSCCHLRWIRWTQHKRAECYKVFESETLATSGLFYSWGV